MLLPNFLIDNAWSFGRADGTLIAPVVRFLSRGMVGGYSNPSEQCWEFVNGFLRFQTLSGETTTLFDDVQLDAGESPCELRGQSRVDTSVTHVLRRTRMPSLVNVGNSANSGAPIWLKSVNHTKQEARRNLVVLRAGRNSLHTQWPRDIDPEDRNWDLCLSWYDQEIPGNFDDCEYFIHQPKERKFSAIFEIFRKDSFLWNYEHIWLPDDDLMTSWRDINRLFNVVRRQDFPLAQPSLVPTSFVNHHVTATHPESLLRYTQFVEIMCPVFASDFLKICVPTFEGSIYGFGLDHVWATLLGRQASRMAIIDNIAVAHTRPMAGNYNFNEALEEGGLIESLYNAYVNFHADGALKGDIRNL